MFTFCITDLPPRSPPGGGLGLPDVPPGGPSRGATSKSESKDMDFDDLEARFNRLKKH